LTELPSKHYSGHCKAAETDGDLVLFGSLAVLDPRPMKHLETPGKELWEKKCGGNSWDSAGAR